MTDQEQLELLRLLIFKDSSYDEEDELLEALLENARAIQLNALFPYDDKATVSEENFRLRNWQVRCAKELYESSDRSGVQSYSENGLNVSYFANIVSQSLMMELTPKAGCPIGSDNDDTN
jgi:hypothetical protein